MPVSLSEWRVRIGTFVHWIREYEVKERREKLLKERIRRLKVLCERLEAKRGDSGEESEDDKKRKDGPDPKGCPHKTVNIQSSGNSSDIKDLLTSCDQCIQDLLTASKSDSHIKEILTPSSCCIKELITPNDCSMKSPNTLNDSTIKDIITPNNAGLKELVTTDDPRIQNLVKANDDSRIQGLFKANDASRIQDLLTTNYSSIRDLITPKYCSIQDVIVSKNAGTKPLDTPNDTFNASSIKDLITPNDSSIIDLITSEYSIVKDLITSNDSKGDSPNEINIKQLLKPDDDYIEEQLAQAYDYAKTVRTIDDEISIEQDAQVGNSEEQQISDFSISQRHSVPDDLNADLIKVHENQSDGSVKELLSPGSGTTVCRPFAPCDGILVELLTPTVSASKDLPSIDVGMNRLCKVSHFLKRVANYLIPWAKSSILNLILSPRKQLMMNSSRSIRHHLGPETNIRMAGKRSPVVPIVSWKYYISERHGEKQMGESALSCHGPSLKSNTDLISGQIPPLSELLLLKSGDVELNPGPRKAAGWSLELEGELLSLVEDVSPEHYTRLCNALGIHHARSKAILSENLLVMPNSLFEVICSWGVKQRDGTNYKRLLAETLRSVHLDALGTKLLEGGYLTQDTPTQSSVTDEVHRVNKLTQEEIIRCGDDFKTFYRTEMCKIKTDPLDFDSLKEFETIYTHLVLLRNEMGTNIKTPFEYDELLTKQINGGLTKRILVKGEGGAGKTTFCSKIAWDWANGYRAYEHFDWVIVIPMREIKDCKTVGDIAKTYLSDGNMVQPRQIDDYILSEQSKVLIIFDGLDEYSRDIFSDESDFGKVIRSEKFKECFVLITSRPWRANEIKLHQKLCKIYTFIGVEGFSSENVSSYINKYFVDDNTAGADLIKFMEDNDVIKENMAPFPIYVVMLCILWRESTEERREVIRELKTFSQLFHQMIAFLKHHYITKSYNTLTEILITIETESINKVLIEIGKIAFSGLLGKQLTFNENVFSSCKEAMDVCSKIGILSREKRFVQRVKRAGNEIQPVTFDVSFTHKLFQEYVAALYLASLYESNYEEYTTSINKALEANVYEFEYLLYFTSSQGKGVGLDIINRLDCEDDFLVDVAFEAYDADSGKIVGQRIFREQNSLEINDSMSAHTVSGYLFIMEQHAMKTLILSRRECGPSVSRDLAEALSSPTSLTTTISKTTFHDDFYRFLLDHVSTSKRGESINAVKDLYIDDRFINGLHKFDTTIEVLFPRLKQLTVVTLQTISPGVVERLAHSSLAVLSIGHGEEGKKLVPLIGEPTSLGQLFSSSFPRLACLTFRELVMGNIRSEAILQNLKNHLHLKSISIISCFTDDKLDPLAEQINTENRMKITLQHDTAQGTLCFVKYSIGPLTIDMIDALCHQTCVYQLDVFEEGVEIAGEEHFPNFHGREVDSKIHTLSITGFELYDNQLVSCCLGKFLSLLPHLANLDIHSCSLNDDFYKEIADRAPSSQIQKIIIGHLHLHNDQSSGCLGKFLSLLSHLTHLNINSCSLHDDFYKEIADRASLSQIQTVNLDFSFNFDKPVKELSHSASKQLANFLCSLPYLTTLEIIVNAYLPDDFFTELGSLAASSQSHYFKEKKHMKMLQEWSESKHQTEHQLNQFERQMTSTHQEPSLPHHVPLLESARPSGQFQSDPHRGIQSEPQQVQEFPIEGRHHSLHRSSGEASRHLVGHGYSLRVHTGLTSFHLSSKSSNVDMPSTSGSRSTRRRKGAAPVDCKRIHSNEAKDDGDRVDESLGQRPGKRRAKTNRKPPAPSS